MQHNDYQAFIQQLTANLQSDARVQGLVLLGSTANQNHKADVWSDHDFFVVTTSGQQENFRNQFGWLPDDESIVLTVRETLHGLKVLYLSGHILEFAVFDQDEITTAKVNDYTIVFDRGGIAAAIHQVATISQQVDEGALTVGIQRDMGMFLCLLVIGAGRAARGEVISGQVFIRTYALGYLLSGLTHALQAPGKPLLDNLDPYRRFEQVFPQIGAEINAVLRLQPVDVSLGLLDIYERVLHDVEGFPRVAVITVREFLLDVSQQMGKM